VARGVPQGVERVGDRRLARPLLPRPLHLADGRARGREAHRVRRQLLLLRRREGAADLGAAGCLRAQQRELQRQQQFIDRFRAKATKATQVKSREKMLAKIERIEAPRRRLARSR
jgi:ATPase subunit of ABC transporter with duplicated ATPase domains